MTLEDDDELIQLRAELERERQLNDDIEKSIAKLEVHVAELESRESEADERVNTEWKTRYETQVDLNHHLEKHALNIADKIEDAKRLFEESKLHKSLAMFDDGQEMTAHHVKMLERTKRTMEGELKSLEWRLDQEAQAFHKANEDRKKYVMDVTAVRGSVELLRVQLLATAKQYSPGSSPDTGSGSSNRTPRIQNGFDNHKIEPTTKKAPAITKLPRID